MIGLGLGPECGRKLHQYCSSKRQMASTNMTMPNMPANAQTPVQQIVSPVVPQVGGAGLIISKVVFRRGG